MALSRRRALLMALAFMACHGARALAQAQATPPAELAAVDAERQKIVSSERWHQALRKWNEWLSVQKTYTPEQVSVLRADLNDSVATMSPKELETFLTDMEERLEVLMSPEAGEARQWIAQILAVARNPESQFGGPLPDVAHMSASQIRDELRRFQQQRAARQQSQAAFDRSRQRQVQAALDVHSARRDASSAAPRTAATFPEPQIPYRSPYAPLGPSRRAASGRPIYRIGPWGEPIFWDPMRTWLPWESRW
jgi:hypothetical protein